MSNEEKDYYNDYLSNCCKEEMADGYCTLCQKKCSPVDAAGDDIAEQLKSDPSIDYSVKNRVIAWADAQDLSNYLMRSVKLELTMAFECGRALDLPGHLVYSQCSLLLDTYILSEVK